MVTENQNSLLTGDDFVYEIKKHSSIVQMSGVTSLQERKTMNALVWIAKDQLKRSPEQRVFSCDVGLLKRLMGMKDNDNTELKTALRTLHALQFEYNILHKDDSKQWKLLSFMAEVTINEEGRGRPTIVSFEFPSSVWEAVKNPNMYVKLDLLIIRGLESKHSIVLYEVLKDYINLWKFRFDLGDFKKLMGIKPKQYSNFTMFIKRVLEVAVAEINDKTDIEVSYSLEKLGRQTIGLWFQMKPKTKEKKDVAQQGLLEQLLSFGLSKEQAEALMLKHDAGYLLANIEIVKEQIAKGEVHNTRAYLLKALQVDFREQDNVYKKQLEAQAQEAEAERQQKEAEGLALEGFKSDFEQERRERLALALQALGTEKTAQLQAGFLDTLNPIFQRYYQKGGLEHLMIQAQRTNHLAKELLPEQYHAQDNYIAYRKTERD